MQCEPSGSALRQVVSPPVLPCAAARPMPAPLAPPTSGEIARQIARRAGRAAIALILLAAVSSRTSADANVLFNPELDQVLLHSGWRIYFGSMLDWTGA